MTQLQCNCTFNCSLLTAQNYLKINKQLIPFRFRLLGLPTVHWSSQQINKTIEGLTLESAVLNDKVKCLRKNTYERGYLFIDLYF